MRAVKAAATSDRRMVQPVEGLNFITRLKGRVGGIFRLQEIS